MPSRDKIDHFHYDLRVRRALRQMLAKVLREAASIGIPDRHSFDIVFRTDTGRSIIPPSLKSQYPDMMRIVLRKDIYSDLEVGENSFEVVVDFSGRPMRLNITLEDIVSFSDPAGHFSVEFEVLDAPLEVDDASSEDSNVILFKSAIRHDDNSEI